MMMMDLKPRSIMRLSYHVDSVYQTDPGNFVLVHGCPAHYLTIYLKTFFLRLKVSITTPSALAGNEVRERSKARNRIVSLYFSLQKLFEQGSQVAGLLPVQLSNSPVVPVTSCDKPQALCRESLLWHVRVLHATMAYSRSYALACTRARVRRSSATLICSTSSLLGYLYTAGDAWICETLRAAGVIELPIYDPVSHIYRAIFLLSNYVTTGT